ncbi:hypothetical protein F4804DRAFT_303011 [Jackrogersella minutella]|nr:hypothetical protein F4804DRAFT_303011 [Jackrogersella minutella]
MALGRWTFPTSRKQSSASSSGTNRTNGTTTPTDNEAQDLTKSPSQYRFLRTLTGSFTSHKSKKSSVERDELAHLNKPFNQQNLEHQKILSAFEWNFGRTKTNQSRSSMSGISPSASRTTSVDHGHTSRHFDTTQTHPRFDSTLNHQSPRENPREESRK